MRNAFNQKSRADKSQADRFRQKTHQRTGDLTTFPSKKLRKMPVWQKAHSTTILYAKKMSSVNFPPES